MVRRFASFAIAIAVLCTAVAVSAQTRATLRLKTGESIRGDLVDMGDTGFTLSVAGKQRQIATDDVAMIGFGGRVESSAPKPGEHLLLLRNGQTLRGKLVDIGGTRPLKITFNVDGKDRDFSSIEVRAIVLGAVAQKR